jgi:hypothetical protein
MASRRSDEPFEGKTMNTRTRTIAMAAALAAAAAVLSSRAANEGASLAADAPAKTQSVQRLADKPAPDRAQRNANAAPQPAWWVRERAEDDGYAWPLPPAPNRRMATIPPTPKVDDAR